MSRFVLAAAAWLAVLTLPTEAAAHLNSPHVYLEREAGPFPVLAVVHMPRAVPGDAVVQVRIQDLVPGEAVSVRVRGIPPAGEEHAPPWQAASPDPIDTSFFTVPVAVYVFGNWAAEVAIEGTRGEGSLRVPFQAEVPKPTEIGTGLTVLLSLLVLLCGLSIWQIGRGFGSEGRLLAGEEPDRKDRLRGLAFGAIGVGLVVFFVGFTLFTWRVSDRLHWSKLRGEALKADVWTAEPPARTGRSNLMRLVVLDSDDQPVSSLGEVDGHPLHVTILDLAGAREIHHLHPRQVRPGAFEVSWRAGVAGPHRLFIEARSSEGRLSTIVSDLQVAAGTPQPLGELAVEGLSLRAPAVATAREVEVGDGLRLAFLGADAGPPVVDELRRLEFELRGPTGEPVGPLEPVERGESGHLIVHRLDGEVFVRLFPSGSVGSGTVASPAAAASPAGAVTRVSFPYAFPSEGAYRLWRELKYRGVARGAAFDLQIAPLP